MISDARVIEIANEVDLTIGDMYDPDQCDVLAFARAIEREATAEATRIMQEWVNAKDAKFATTWDDYERAAMRLDAAGQAMREYLGRMK